MVQFRMPPTAVMHSDHVFHFVRNLYLNIVTDEPTHSSPKSDVIFQGIDKLLRRSHGVDIREQEFLTAMIWAIVTPESMAGVSEKLESVTAASLLLGMLKSSS